MWHFVQDAQSGFTPAIWVLAMKITLVHYPNLAELIGKGWTESELCRIHNIHSRRFQLELPGDDELMKFTVRRLKERLEDEHGLEANGQIVRFKGRVLDDAEPLVSCGVVAGSSLLLGLLRPPPVKKDDDNPDKGHRTKLAERTGSETMTIAQASNPQQPPADAQASAEQAQPWWANSRLSGPQGRTSASAVLAGASSSTDSGRPPSATAAPGPQSSNNAVQPVAATLGNGRTDVPLEGVLSAEELRRKRLSRFS